MNKAIRVHETGGPDVLRLEDVEIAAPGAGEVLLKHTAIGVNLVDTYHRSVTSGQYAIPRPAILGVEAAGIVEEVGPDVTALKVGDRIAYWNVLGAYAERRILPAWRALKIPDGIDDKTAAAALLKGATAFYLIHRIYPVKAGDTILVHAAAGGVGRILCQWAAHLGAQVIGTVGSAPKAEIARASGCAHVVVTGEQDFVAEARAFTHGAGVDAVFDSIGRDTFDQSLDTLRPLGMMVNFGQASGPVPPLDISVLAQKGSLFLAKPTLATFVKDRESILALAQGVFGALLSGAIKVEIGLSAPLAEAARVHRELEARRTTGSIVLVP
ncbi:MAG TPA: quinone oxidoreductase [Xanthobacteraceae bacterium]|nr:MAG: quinone oxidoreductase [Rhizobiales bacterium 39-66-18]HQS10085.1 quinone oxidoreductase [Xanthobacteraceae bacterium]HQS45009.1 quinone oxidoreductase [Xanthobacteraceae bacterium]